MRLTPILLAFACLSLPPAAAHPHVFVEPQLEVTGDSAGHLKALRNVWRMDEMFSASVVVDFDTNGDGKLDKTELSAVGRQVRGSIERWSFYTFVRKAGAPVSMVADPVLDVGWDAKRSQLVFALMLKPDAPLDMTAGDVSISIFDDTYFVAFAFKSAKNVSLRGLPGDCRALMQAPTPDEAAKTWMATIAAIPVDADVPADGIKFSESLATKFVVHCG